MAEPEASRQQFQWTFLGPKRASAELTHSAIYFSHVQDPQCSAICCWQVSHMGTCFPAIRTEVSQQPGMQILHGVAAKVIGQYLRICVRILRG